MAMSGVCRMHWPDRDDRNDGDTVGVIGLVYLGKWRALEDAEQYSSSERNHLSAATTRCLAAGEGVRCSVC